MNQKINMIGQFGIVSAADLNGKINYANEGFYKISGYSNKELMEEGTYYPLTNIGKSTEAPPFEYGMAKGPWYHLYLQKS
jgi:PAS domain-containing protein